MIKDKEIISEYFTKHYSIKDKYVYNEIVYFLGGAIAFVIAIFIAMMRTSSADQRSVYDSYSTSKNKKYRETYDDLVEEIDNTTDIKPKEKEKIKNQAAEIDAKRTELKELTEERKKELVELLKILDEDIKQNGSEEQKKQYEDIKKLLGSVDSLGLEENLKKLQNFINESNINVDKEGIDKKFNFIYDIFNREKSLFKAIGNLWTKFTMNFGTNLKGGIVNIINEWGGFFTNKKSDLKIEDLADQISKEEIIYISCSGFNLLDEEIRIEDTNSISFKKGDKTNIFYHVKKEKIFITDSNKEQFIYISKDNFLTQEKFVEFIQIGTLKLNENIIKITTDFKDSNFKIPVKILSKIDSNLEIKAIVEKIQLEIDPFDENSIRLKEKNFVLFDNKTNLSLKIEKIDILNNSKALSEAILNDFLNPKNSVFEIKNAEVVSTILSLKDSNIDDLLKGKIIALRDKNLKLDPQTINLSDDILVMETKSIDKNTNFTDYELSSMINIPNMSKTQEDIEEEGKRKLGIDRPNIIYYIDQETVVLFSIKDKEIAILEKVKKEDFKTLIESKNYSYENEDSYHKMDAPDAIIPIIIKDKKDKELIFTFFPYSGKKIFNNQINFYNNKIVITDYNLHFLDGDDPKVPTKKTIYNIENLNSDGLFEFLLKFPFFLKTPIKVNVSQQEIITDEEVLMNIDFDSFLKGKIVESKENKILICRRGKAVYYLKIENNEDILKSFKDLDVNSLVTQINESLESSLISEKYIILPIENINFNKNKIINFQVMVKLYEKVVKDLKGEDEEIETGEESPSEDMLSGLLSDDSEEEEEDPFADLGNLTSGANDFGGEDPLFSDIPDPVDVLKQIYNSIENKKFTPSEYIDKSGNINFSDLISNGIMDKIEINDFITSKAKLEFLKNKIKDASGNLEPDENDYTFDSSTGSKSNVTLDSFNYKNKFNNLQTIFNEIFYREIKGKKYNYFENESNIEMIPLITAGEIILSKIPSIINVKDLNKINPSNVFEYDLSSKSITKVPSNNHNIDYLKSVQDKIIFIQKIQKKGDPDNLYEGDLKINKLTPGVIEVASEFFKFNEDNEKIKNVIKEENSPKDIRKNFLSGIRCKVEIIESEGSITYKVITKGQISSNKFDKKIKDLNDEEKNNLKDVIKKTIEKQKESSSKEQTSDSEPELEISSENIETILQLDPISFFKDYSLVINEENKLMLIKKDKDYFLKLDLQSDDVKKINELEEFKELIKTKFEKEIIVEQEEQKSDENINEKKYINLSIEKIPVTYENVDDKEKIKISPDEFKKLLEAIQFSFEEIFNREKAFNFYKQTIDDNFKNNTNNLSYNILKGLDHYLNDKLNKEDRLYNNINRIFLGKKDNVKSVLQLLKNYIIKEYGIESDLYKNLLEFAKKNDMRFFISDSGKVLKEPEITDKTPFTKGKFFLSLEKIKANDDTLSDNVDSKNGGIIFRQKKDSDTEFIGTLWTPNLDKIEFDELKKLQKYFNISLADYVLNEEFEVQDYQKGFISDDKLIITIIDDNKASVKQKGNLRDASRAQIITNLRKILQDLIKSKPEENGYQEKKKEVYQKFGIEDLFREKDGLTPAEVSESASSDIGLIIGKISGENVKLGVGAPISLQLMNKFKNNKNYKLFYYIKRDENYYYIELNENIIKLLNTIFSSQSFKDSKNVRYKIDDLKEKIKENILLFRKVFKIDPKKISEKVKLDDMKLGIIKKERLIEKNKKKFFRFPTEEVLQPKIKESDSEEKNNQETPDQKESITSSYKIDNNFDSIIINEVFKKWKR